ncbi:hypothetical protein [Mycolicibacterium sp.]|uniref:hypothetical protein n=1 Tax=Mycolicibacterium sp. TaxID=2320850 RepID=UPI00355EEB9D
MPQYRDAGTGAPLDDGALERRHRNCVDAGHRLGFDDWLRSEIADGHIESVA